MKWSKGIFLSTVVSLCGCTNIFLQPHEQILIEPSTVGLSFEAYRAPSGAFQGWRLLTPSLPKGVVLFLHGNGGNISAHLGSVAWMPREGFEVVMLEYPGYGGAQGNADIDEVFGAVRTASAEIAKEAEERKIPLVVIGESLGGAIALHTVASGAMIPLPSCVISVSAFASYRAIAREKLSSLWLTYLFQYPLSFLVKDTYSPDRNIHRLKLPLLLLHGRKDLTVPSHHSERLRDLMQGSETTLLLHEGAHDGTLLDPSLQEKILQFVTHSCRP